MRYQFVFDVSCRFSDWEFLLEVFVHLSVFFFILCLTIQLLFVDFALECAIRQVRENWVTLKLNGTHIEVFADYVNLLGENHKETNMETK
jgi:hypothetical protein